MTTLSKSEFVERELKAWKEVYEIPFQDLFKVEMIHDLRWTFEATPREHIKNKRDIIDTIMVLQNQLKLTPKTKTPEQYKEESTKVLFNLLQVATKQGYAHLQSFFKTISSRLIANGFYTIDEVWVKYVNLKDETEKMNLLEDVAGKFHLATMLALMTAMSEKYKNEIN